MPGHQSGEISGSGISSAPTGPYPRNRIEEAIAMWAWCAVLFTLLTANLWAVDLAAIQQEPNLERRSQLAMDYAGTALDAARTAYQSSDLEKTKTSLSEVGSAVDLAYDSLQQTGKEVRRDSKFFKRAELSTRQLLRRIEGLSLIHISEPTR